MNEKHTDDSERAFDLDAALLAYLRSTVDQASQLDRAEGYQHTWYLDALTIIARIVSDLNNRVHLLERQMDLYGGERLAACDPDRQAQAEAPRNATMPGH